MSADEHCALARSMITLRNHVIYRDLNYSQTPHIHNPYMSVDGPGYGLSGVMGSER